MDFGGYVAFTIGGFKCLPFGSAPIAKAIELCQTELDIPQSIALRPSRVGFRRSLLRSADAGVVCYSCFVGISEVRENRLGSFLSVGVAFRQDVDCVPSNIGQALYHLLVDLAERVSNGNKFTTEINLEIVNSFLKENTPTLEEIQRRSVPTTRVISGKLEQPLLFLSDEKVPLDTAFNRACSFIPPYTNLFIFESSATSELQNAKHDFKVLSWPLRAMDADVKIPPLPPKGSQPVPAAEPTKDAGRYQQLERDIERYGVQSERCFEAVDRRFESRELYGMIAISTIAVLSIMAMGLGYFWHSSTQDEIVSLRKDLVRLKPSLSERDNASQEGAARRHPDVGVNGSSAAPSLDQGQGQSTSVDYTGGERSVVLKAKYNFKQIREEFCISLPQATFVPALRKLNPGLDPAKEVDKGVQVFLPKTCS